MADIKKQVIYMEIAGFTIEIDFYSLIGKKVYDPWINTTLAKNIRSSYQVHVIKKINHPVSFTIQLIRHFPTILTKQKNKITLGYMHLFTSDETKIITLQHISINQFNLILFTVLQKLIDKDGGFIIHASASIVDNTLYVFCADSGGGKSTSMKLLHPEYEGFADDILIIKKIRNSYYGFQSPIIEKNNWIRKSQEFYKIGKVFILHKKLSFHMIRIKNKERITTLFSKQLFVTKNRLLSQSKNLFFFVNKFNFFFHLWFKKEKKLVEMIRD